MNTTTSYRRRTGLLLGAALGLGYGLVSQLINHFYLPGIPLYQPPMGFLGNILIWTFALALLGWISARSAESIQSVFFSAVAAALAIAVITLMSGDKETESLPRRVMTLVLFLVPLTAFMVPFIGLHRWAVNREVEFELNHAPLLQRLPVPLLMILLVSAAGLFSLHSTAARLQISRLHAMLQQGLRSSQPVDLPPPLQEVLVAGFLERASQHYQIEWDNKDTSQYGIPRRASSRSWEEAALIAHFDNGWDLICIYPDSQAEPSCGSAVAD